MKKKLSELASIAEIIGAFAVVISLIYVGIQVNDSAGAVRSGAANDANVAMQSWFLQVGSDQQTSDLVYRGLLSEEPLSNAEEFQYLMMMHAVFLGFQNNYLLAEEGTIDPQLRESVTMSINGVRQLPGMRRFWRQRKSYLHSGFVEWAEHILNRDTEITMDLYRLPEAIPENE
jgi:hypothetical protein